LAFFTPASSAFGEEPEGGRTGSAWLPASRATFVCAAT
jgi:hypothetical protein